MITGAHYRLAPLMCLVLLGIGSRNPFPSNFVAVPVQGVLAFANLDNSFFVTQSDAGEVSEVGGQFGAALIVGDFNGDRVKDLAVGAPGDGPAAAGPAKVGSVFVFTGSAAGITEEPVVVITHADQTDPEDAWMFCHLQMGTSLASPWPSGSTTAI